MRIITYSIGLNRGTEAERPYQLAETLDEVRQTLVGDRVLHIGITQGSWQGVPERVLQVKVSFDDLQFMRNRDQRGAVPRDPVDFVHEAAGRVAQRLGQQCIAVHHNGSPIWMLCYGDNEHLDGHRVEFGCTIRDNPLIEGNGSQWRHLID